MRVSSLFVQKISESTSIQNETSELNAPKSSLADAILRAGDMVIILTDDINGGRMGIMDRKEGGYVFILEKDTSKEVSNQGLN